MKLEYQIIKRKDNFCSNENQFISLLETNQSYKIIKEKMIIEYKNINIKYAVKKYLTLESNEIMFILSFIIDDENDLGEFEKFDKSFLDFLTKFNKDFTLNILWDEISRRYAEDMYTKIFYIESLLRKIIYYFMGKNVGKEWIKKCFPSKVQNSIQTVKEKNNTENDENILYYADFIQLNYLLFNKYSKEIISQSEIIEKIKEKDCDINELVNKYEYKSNWDRYFEPIVNKDNLEENLNDLYQYRNLVAHNRKIRENDKNTFVKLSDKIEKILQKCLNKIDDIKVPEEEKENLENMSSQMFNPLTYNIGISPGITSTLDSLRIGIENSGITSAVNSLKMGIENSGITSVVDSWKIGLGMNSGIISSLDSLKVGIENSGIASYVESAEIKKKKTDTTEYTKKIVGK